VNLPFPAGTTGDTYRLAFDDVVRALAEEFAPTCSDIPRFDAHRPILDDLGLRQVDLRT